MMLVTNAHPTGVPMPVEGPAVLAAYFLTALESDTLYLRAQVLSRLHRAGCANPEIALESALAAGWVMQEVCGSIGYAQRSWLPTPRSGSTNAPLPLPQMSFFKPPITNVFPSKKVTLAYIAQLILGPSLVTQTQTLRALPRASEARCRLKLSLPSFTAGGLFTRRAAGSLEERSGLLVLDFDHVPDLLGTRARLLADAELPIELLFISPSGDGIKAVVRVSLACDHVTNFSALVRFLRLKHGIAPDTSGSNVDRACFICHDPEAWIHPMYHPLAYEEW